MRRPYRKLNLDERRILATMLQAKATKTKIAETLGRDRSTIHREIKRNWWHDEEVPQADFTNDVDTLDLSYIDADATTGGNQAFDLIGRAGFTAAGQLRVQWSDSRIVLQADIDGDGITDFEIELRNLASIQSNDILL